MRRWLMKLCELENNCMHIEANARAVVAASETSANTSPRKIRLATPLWEKVEHASRVVQKSY
ncbi:hypothetical protein SBA5_220138 [Candidatus Sulfotelmatomonas gaucii]|uniref:Uncharacterized protein n=1 Tax=Candidatus Sulfuritelmatomonas gaucii TaxID=2043161 RepID=A0A2N9L7L7_9BACT|nr:hypothetical protein SBA5_220138 [Candidatus Sulfotelmatomonas gaucii]